ncbi:hypothetical protein JYU34_001372 [Plutella xylostella]|uniref:Uncharacterized protein n=1 Tax=Plutella xylostella TaxID=51655 RepID=A0ABQ7R3R4_PLUXY|nr:hypothetical protein JYU34_001372 [Plutella xylostella]
MAASSHARVGRVEFPETCKMHYVGKSQSARFSWHPAKSKTSDPQSGMECLMGEVPSFRLPQ